DRDGGPGADFGYRVAGQVDPGGSEGDRLRGNAGAERCGSFESHLAGTRTKAIESQAVAILPSDPEGDLVARSPQRRRGWFVELIAREGYVAPDDLKLDVAIFWRGNYQHS